MMKKKAGQRGVFFTLAIILLIIPLIFLVSFYVGSSKTKIEDTTAKIRCDELHYFVEDVERDLSRALVIFGRRAAIYSVDYVIHPPGNPLLNYSFNCNPSCGMDCGELIYPEPGSEAAIAELTLCGTLNGTNVTYMINHTLKEWMNRIEIRGRDMNFHVNITPKEIKVIPVDAWHFAILIDNNVDIIDETGICYYRETTVKTESNTSIIGLEDPLYTLSGEGNVMKYIYNCDEVFTPGDVIGNGSDGNGSGSGDVILESSIPEPDQGTFCSENDVSGLIVVFVNGYGSCGDFESICYDVTAEEGDHFAGVINYGKNAIQSFTEKCNISIPWIRDTGNLDLSDDECIYIESNETVSHVVSGIDHDDINFSCYQISNISEYASCAVNLPDGPSFFDRLDGSYNLSGKYLNQSRKYFNNSFIGIETFIDLHKLMDHDITPYVNATWIDYLYWRNTNGSRVCEACENGYTLRLDCQHIERYGLSEC